MSATARSLSSQFRLLDLELPSKPTLVPPPPPLEPGESEAVRQLRASLGALSSKVSSATELIRALDRKQRNEVVPTTLAPLDALLGGGLARGKVIEVASRHAAGRLSIALSALVTATTSGEAAALIDLGDHFDPQLAEQDGVDLRRLLWVRPRTLKQAVMSAEMITATGFQLVVVDLGLHPLRGPRVHDAAWVRLARTAEAHGAAMLVSSPYPVTGTASEAVVRARHSRAKWLGRGRSPRLLDSVELRLTLEKHRHIRPGSNTTVILRVPDSALATQHS